MCIDDINRDNRLPATLPNNPQYLHNKVLSRFLPSMVGHRCYCDISREMELDCYLGWTFLA